MIIVFANEWDGNVDPIKTYYLNGTCINLNTHGYEFRNKLIERARNIIPDCQFNVPYHVVICDILP